MAKIIATYSPCCGIFHLGDAEPGIMHCALPHEKIVVKLVDEKELDMLDKENRRLTELARAMIYGKAPHDVADYYSKE